MPALPPPVERGDLITADLMNALLGKLGELETRVANLEAGSQSSTTVIITDLIPPGTAAAPIRVSSELRIVGQNFRFSLGAHRVFFDATRVDAFKPGSNDSLLIFDVPN